MYGFLRNKFNQVTFFLLYLRACIVLLISNGFRKTLSIVTRYPGIVMMATFSCWTIGDSKISKCGNLFGKDEKIGISPVHTWMNFILTTGLAIFSFTKFILKETDPDGDIFYISISTSIFFGTLMALPILVTMILLLHGDHISCCLCCTCCTSNCKSNQYTLLNTANMQEELTIQEDTNQQSPFNKCCTCSYKRFSCFCVVLFIVLIFTSFYFMISMGIMYLLPFAYLVYSSH